VASPTGFEPVSPP